MVECSAFDPFAGGVEVGGACRDASKVAARSVGIDRDYGRGLDAVFAQFATGGSVEQWNTGLCCVVGDCVAFSECAFVIASTVPVASANPDDAEGQGGTSFLDEVLKVLVGV